MKIELLYKVLVLSREKQNCPENRAVQKTKSVEKVAKNQRQKIKLLPCILWNEVRWGSHKKFKLKGI